MKIENTYKATICLGLKEGYTGSQHDIWEVEEICQKFCTEVKCAVTVSPTTFIYVDGYERGCFVEFIQYPRFPISENDIRDRALKLAKILMIYFKQERVSVVMTDTTFLIEKQDLDMD